MANILIKPEKSSLRKTVKTKEQKEPSLKGTFVSVMLVGGFLLFSWLLVFLLFLIRN